LLAQLLRIDTIQLCTLTSHNTSTRSESIKTSANPYKLITHSQSYAFRLLHNKALFMLINLC
jgi:hypothetical protein